MRRLLTLLRAASKPTLTVASLAFLGLAGGGAYVALAAPNAPKVGKPLITSGPANPTNQTGAAFTFTSTRSVTFICSLDGGGFAACGSGTSGSKAYAGPLAQGTHTFRVDAQSGSETSDPATWSWTVDTAPPPAPTIVGHPADPTADTAATFSHSDTEAGVSYLCKLDAGAFQSCGSSKSYSGLGLGGHAFQVKAVDKAGNPSGPTAFSWTIVPPPPPKPTIISAPANPTNQTSAGFTYADTSSVSFLCSLDGGAFAACGSGTSGAKTYPGPLGDGSHTFQVKAQQGGGLMSAADSRTWIVDTVQPPAPTFTKTPSNPTNDKKASFLYNDAESGVSFKCKLDAAAYANCGNSANYNNLSQGSHTFCVQAIDKAGNVSTAACFTWQIGAAAAPFTMSGNPLAGVLLYPGGPPVPINLVFTNPSGSPITIQSTTVSVTGTSPAGCGAGAFAVTQQLSATPTVPANSTRSLQALGVPQASWPQLQMTSSGNQNTCQNATVNLGYSGTAN
jgi:hypothetical protein